MARRFNQCGLTDWVDRQRIHLQFGTVSTTQGTTASYWPTLDDTSTSHLLALLSLHIAIPPKIDPQTAKDVVDYIVNSAILFYQTPGAESISDPAYFRWGSAIHSNPGTMFSGRPFSHSSHMDYHDRFLNGLILFGLSIGMPESLIPWMKWHPIGYDGQTKLGRHNDTPNNTDRWEFKIRLALCMQLKRKIQWTLMEVDGTTGTEAFYRGDDGKTSSKITLDASGFTVYAMSSCGCGSQPLGVVGSSNNLVVAHHEIHNESGERAVVGILDLYLDSSKSMMRGMNLIRSNQFSLDFSRTDYVEKYFYGKDTLKVSNIA